MVTFAEELGIIEQFDLVVCQRAVQYLMDEGRGSQARLAVNLSAQSVESDMFIDTLLELLKGTRVADKLLFEITESTRIKDLKKTDMAIQRLRSQGFCVGLDDFGAGSASIDYLHALTVDFVKIDGTYVREILSDHRSALILKALCTLCRDLGVYTVAEMVETREQVAKLRELGLDCGQGYFFGKPAPQMVVPETTIAENVKPVPKVVSARGGYRTWT
jgi:EAL domain-containing protein (putative c-di-GMP-specific phosphodiesterase class I)